MFILFTVGLLSLVQSLFGFGLLLFGTPILIVQGCTFREALWIVLPASITISILQLMLDRQLDRHAALSLILWTVPSVGLGLLLILSLSVKIKIDFFIFSILLVCALLRFSTKMMGRVAEMCHNYRRSMLLLIGFIHGLTNMGGSLLSIYAAGQSSDKYAIRQYVALGYVIFATIQVTVLIFTEPGQSYPNPLKYIVLGGVVFICVGRAAFHHITQQRYTLLLNWFIVACAAILLGKSFIIE